LKHKCDHCDRPATHHVIEIQGGKKIEKHLCDIHAAEEGITSKSDPHTPINELLTNFVKLHSGPGAQATTGAPAEVVCENCGLSFSKFRENSLLGCPTCYSSFEQVLTPLVERAHEGGEHHIGKVPRRAGAGELRQVRLMRMRKRLDDAVATEDYELAARIRDEIGELERDT